MKENDFFEKILATMFVTSQSGIEVPIQYINFGNLVIVGDRIIPMGHVSFLQYTARGLVAGEALVGIPCVCSHLAHDLSQLGGICFSCGGLLCARKSCLTRRCVLEEKLCCPSCSTTIEDGIVVSKIAQNKSVIWRMRAKKIAAERRKYLAEKLLQKESMKEED